MNLEPSFDVSENLTFWRAFSSEDYVQSTTQIENRDFHYNIWNDLVEHL
jgi:hypothetical protein